MRFAECVYARARFDLNWPFLGKYLLAFPPPNTMSHDHKQDHHDIAMILAPYKLTLYTTQYYAE